MIKNSYSTYFPKMNGSRERNRFLFITMLHHIVNFIDGEFIKYFKEQKKLKLNLFILFLILVWIPKIIY